MSFHNFLAEDLVRKIVQLLKEISRNYHYLGQYLEAEAWKVSGNLEQLGMRVGNINMIFVSKWYKSIR